MLKLKHRALLITVALMAAAVSLPAHPAGRGKWLRAPQDTIPVIDSLAVPAVQDTLPPMDSAAFAAYSDSLHLQNLRDSIDRIFWGEIDTVSLPLSDSINRYVLDSLARNLPDTSDIKRAMRRIRKEERDSLRAAKPRVIETFVIPDSMYYRRILVWTSDKYFNEYHEAGLDTTANSNYYDQPMYKKDINATWLGTNGSATLYHNWFRREEAPDAPMFTPYIGDSQTDETIKQYNTKTPYTELAYWGTPFANKTMEESNVKLLSTQNITPQFNFTLAYRQMGSKGLLQNEKTDNRTTVIIGNYMGKRYFANFGTIRQRVTRTENGGIHDSFWIRDTIVEAKSIQVNLAEASNLYKRRSYFIHQTLAVPMNFFRKDRDSLSLGEGTMAHLGHSAEFTTYSKVYTDKIAESDTCGHSFYHNYYLNPISSYDDLAVRNLENRVFIKLQPFAPDAILAKVNGGIGYQLLSTYAFKPSDYVSGRKFDTQHNLYVYGGASGMLKKYLAWDATADYYFAGYRMFDFDIDAKLRLSVYPLDKGIHLIGKFHTGLKTPHPFEQQIYMNHHRWDNDFSKTSTTRAEAELKIPKWRLEAGFGYALVAGLLYYDTDAIVRQHTEPVSIMSAYLRKDFTVWRLHFDNQALFQLTSAPEDVLPLPKLTLNLRWYFDIDVVKGVMNLQAGVNAIYNTAWYAPSYAPDIGQFHNQNMELIGNVPYFDIFLNAQWKQVSIFIKYTNAFKDWPKSDYFSAYHYIKPLPAFRFGIHWPFYVF